MTRAVPVLTLHGDEREPLARERGPGIQRNGTLGGFERGLEVSQVDRIRGIFIQQPLVRGGRLEDRARDLKGFRVAPGERERLSLHAAGYEIVGMLRESFVERGKDEGSDFPHLRTIGQKLGLGRHGDRQLSIQRFAIL